MKTTVVAVVTSVLAMSACGVTNPAAAGQDISGRYELTTADGARRLPCCTTTDSSGSTATLVAGSLVLDQAVSQDSVATPDGWMPKACVHHVPNGAHVDTSGLVTLPDGSTYQLSKCQTGAFSMSVTNQFQDPSGSVQQRAVSSTGQYDWDGTTLVLVDAAGDELMAGGPSSDGAFHLSDGKHTYVFSPSR